MDIASRRYSFFHSVFSATGANDWPWASHKTGQIVSSNADLSASASATAMSVTSSRTIADLFVLVQKGSASLSKFCNNYLMARILLSCGTWNN
jgi:hypothetical protein